MLFGDDELFSIVRSAKLGQIELPPVLAHLRDWIHDQFAVWVVHIVFGHVENGSSLGRPRLTVILEADADYDSWQTDVVTIRPAIERRVLSQFIKLAQADPKRYDSEGVFLILDNFSDECLGRACSTFLKKEAKRITKDFSLIPIWEIDGFSRDLVVFLKTERDILLNSDNGTCDEISKRCFDGVKQYDEFGYLSDASFRL